MGRPEDKFRNGTFGSSSKDNNSVFKKKQEYVFGKKQEKELVTSKEKESIATKEQKTSKMQDSLLEETKVLNEESSQPVNKSEKAVETLVQVTDGLSEVNEQIQAGVAFGVDYLDKLLASKKVSVVTPKKDQNSSPNSNQTTPEYFANKRARKRLVKVSIKLAIRCIILVNLVNYVRGVVNNVTTEDLYMYGYKVESSEDKVVMDFIVKYNSTHENSYLVTTNDYIEGGYQKLYLIIENAGYKEWIQTKLGQTFMDYYSSLDDVGVYNLQLESYKLGDELAVEMEEVFGNTVELGIYEGLTSNYEDSVYDFFHLGSINVNLVLSYDFYGPTDIQRTGSFPNNAPDLFASTEVNVLPEYWGLTDGN